MLVRAKLQDVLLNYVMPMLWSAELQCACGQEAGSIGKTSSDTNELQPSGANQVAQHSRKVGPSVSEGLSSIDLHGGMVA